MSEKNISEDFEIIHVIPDRRDQGDPLPSVPDPYQPDVQDDLYMRMDSIATTTYSNEVAPPPGRQEYPQVHKTDSGYDDYNRPYNPMTSPARSPEEYRPPPRNESDGFPTRPYTQHATTPSYPPDPHYPDNSQNQYGRRGTNPNNAFGGHPYTQNAYSHPSDSYVRAPEPNNPYPRENFPNSPYGGDSNPGHIYDRQLQPNNPYARENVPTHHYGGVSNPGQNFDRQPNLYVRENMPNTPYGGDSNPNNTFDRLPDPNNPYGGDSNRGNTYDRQQGPINPNAEVANGRKPDPTYDRDYNVREVYKNPYPPSNPYGGESNYNNPHPSDPEPQYSQVRKTPSFSTPPHSKLSFESQNTRFDAPYSGVRLPSQNPLPPPNLPPPRFSQPVHDDLPSPRFAPQPVPSRHPTDSDYRGYNPSSNAPYGGYARHEQHVRPQYGQEFSGTRNVGYSEFQHGSQFRQPAIVNEPYRGGGYNLPPPRLPNYPTNVRPDLPQPNIGRNPQYSRDNYFNQGQPPVAYPYNNPQYETTNIYEIIGNEPYSPASRNTAVDPNGLPMLRHHGEDREVNVPPSAMPKPKIPPDPTRRKTIYDPRNTNRDVSQGIEVLRLAPEPPPPPRAPIPPPLPPGWECPACTYRNKPMRPGCEICATARPEEYVVPAGYELDEDELLRQKQAEDHAIQQEEERLIEREQNYQAMIMAADQDLIEVDEEFECSICIMDVDVGDGVRLRECLHAFCRDCLSQHIVHAEDAEVKCPFQGETYQCQSVVTEREVKQLLSPEQYKHWQQMGLNQAEGTIENAFHCKSADCAGWCVYEDDINFFDCPVCKVQNCLTCKAIHVGKNCKEYQADIVNKAKNDDDAKRTQKMLEDMITAGEAMKCPKCDVIIQKKLGCDWIRCTVCKTEICWATKGFRWGPKGKGDTSGGCKCRADGRTPCSPQCHNCH